MTSDDSPPAEPSGTGRRAEPPPARTDGVAAPSVTELAGPPTERDDRAEFAADADLIELASAFGVATSYIGADDRPATVSPSIVRAVLGLLGVDASDPAAALARVREAPWRRLVPSATIVRRNAPAPVVVHVPPATQLFVELQLETGGRLELSDVGPPVGRRTVDGRELVAVPVAFPPGMPLGDHRLRVRAGTLTGTGLVIVVPDRLPTVDWPDPAPAGPAPAGPAPAGPAPAGEARPGADSRRMWGWMVQLYALASAASWGIGDYADLATLADWSGSPTGGGADVLLVNPLHAAAPTLPVQPSPYYPASRRFVSPLYLRPEDTPEYADAPASVRAAVDSHARAARAAQRRGAGAPEPGETGEEREAEESGLIDRDAVWRAKLAALELLYDTARRAGRLPDAEPPSGSHARADADLTDFATWCALAERHGQDWRAWPDPLRDPAGPAVAAARAELADRIGFHRWLQRRCEGQLAAAQAAARAAGMAVGIVHDLAVGVDPGGADAWALQDVLVAGATVGAPPDGFNQQGQDWGLPPWRPDRLAQAGYAPFRQMISAVLRRGGGLRVDHILGLFRLWWVPAGNGAAEGTYVRYDADAMLGVLALEATRAGALVVGEDLGTVEASVATALARVGVLGSAVLWFEKDASGAPKRPAAWREQVMASVSTHDLPTAAGFLGGEHVRERARLGLLARPEADELAAWRAEREALVALLRREGLLAEAGEGGDPAVDEVVCALHRMLVASPARIVLASPGDALGDRRQPNLPGTVDAYPNWRLPISDARGVPVTVERLVADPAVRRLAAVLAGVRRAGTS